MHLGGLRLFRFVPFMLLAVGSAVAQSGPTIVDSADMVIAPGEVVTLRVTGLKTVLKAPVRADMLPLPTTLAGISVTISQFYRPSVGVVSELIPLFAIEQANLCADQSSTPDCIITTVTAQVPPIETNLVYPNAETELVISENGVSSKAFRVGGASPVQMRVLDKCFGNSANSCTPAVTHGDGSLVSAASPGRPGEVVVVYAIGLGQTTPAVPAGQATPTPAPVANAFFFVQFDFSANAAPKLPPIDPSVPPFGPKPEFVGLTPGQVGLYQINVTIPDTIPSLQPCTGAASYGLASNLTITISTNANAPGFSFSGAAICVVPPN
jgi:uncharacterized protein (TIGR03437 family)